MLPYLVHCPYSYTLQLRTYRQGQPANLPIMGSVLGFCFPFPVVAFYGLEMPLPVILNIGRCRSRVLLHAA
jgi:hypothetical protein